MRILLLGLLLISSKLSATITDNTTAISWMQNSAEYEAMLIQNYKLAAKSLEPALLDKKWTAAVEQFDTAIDHLPPAVIMSIDDVIVSTMPYRAQLNLDKDPHKRKYYDEWVDFQKAPILPGVVDFIKQASKFKVKILIISNRLCIPERQDQCPTKTKTLAMLKRVGLVFDKDDLLFRGEYPDWRYDKSTRREYLAKRYRILMIIGDDIEDMIKNAADTPSPSRHLYTRQYKDLWGERWFLLPNPVYGSWHEVGGKNLRSTLKGWD
ncbi:hypothetical protein HR060_07260 [Catenovulum sp. SM1970]|uniref:HAD family acid phosphatase n=1 Tax=Marinifaba aquimaris TaxID=2741323 RepID=UPI0015723A80|nr:HAD family acid phosphatase [Marinifaba aquimaris]NTS76665.1 hypothetical protein [Marinifaba aquimaris]